MADHYDEIKIRLKAKRLNDAISNLAEASDYVAMINCRSRLLWRFINCDSQKKRLINWLAF